MLSLLGHQGLTFSKTPLASSPPPPPPPQTQEIPLDSDFPSTHLVHDPEGRRSPACSEQVGLVTTAGDTQPKHALQASSEGQRRGGTEPQARRGGRATHWKECFHSWDPVTVQRSPAEWFSGEDQERGRLASRGAVTGTAGCVVVSKPLLYSFVVCVCGG